jgi:hypothetical protein
VGWRGPSWIGISGTRHFGLDCDNGLDDDGDGLVDCEDADCADLDRDGFDHGGCETDPDDVDCDDGDADVAPATYWEGFSQAPDRCVDGRRNTCDPQDPIDCEAPYCADEHPACLAIGCRAEDQELSEPNDDAFDAHPIAFGETLDGALCVESADTSDFYRLPAVAEGDTVRCVFDWPNNLGRIYAGARVFDPATSSGLGSHAFGDWEMRPPLIIEQTALDWQVGEWILEVRALDPDYASGSNLYDFSCQLIQGPGVPESDCDDGVDQDLDGAVDCADSDCIGNERCPCVVSSGPLTCGQAQAVEMGAGNHDYYRYPCGTSGYLGPGRVFEYTAPVSGTYRLDTRVDRAGARSNDLDHHVIDASASCRYGTCLGSGNADQGSPSSSSFWLSAGQTVHVVLDGRADATSDMTATVQLTCPGGCPDADFDGHAARSCGGTDCDDGDDDVFPGAVEVCDGVDANCVQGDEPWVREWRDADGDGYGDPNQPRQVSCTLSPGFADNADDCDDQDAGRAPDAPEHCGDGIDQDCDLQVDEDCGPSSESDCGDGVDNDGDGALDCQDADCAGSALCPPPHCAAGDALTCGDALWVAPGPGVSSHGANVCAPGAYDADDQLFGFRAPRTEWVTIALDHIDGGDLDVFVYEACDRGTCTGSSIAPDLGSESLGFWAVAGVDYEVVVDPYAIRTAPLGLLTLTCSGQATESRCDDGLDDDGDGHTDCGDIDCAYDSSCVVQSCIGQSPGGVCTEPCLGAQQLTCGDVVRLPAASGFTDTVSGYAGAAWQAGIANHTCSATGDTPDVTFEVVGMPGRSVSVVAWPSQDMDVDLYAVAPAGPISCAPSQCLMASADTIGVEHAEALRWEDGSERRFVVAEVFSVGSGDVTLSVVCDDEGPQGLDHAVAPPGQHPGFSGNGAGHGSWVRTQSFNQYSSFTLGTGPVRGHHCGEDLALPGPGASRYQPVFARCHGQVVQVDGHGDPDGWDMQLVQACDAGPQHSWIVPRGDTQGRGWTLETADVAYFVDAHLDPYAGRAAREGSFLARGAFSGLIGDYTTGVAHLHQEARVGRARSAQAATDTCYETSSRTHIDSDWGRLDPTVMTRVNRHAREVVDCGSAFSSVSAFGRNVWSSYASSEDGTREPAAGVYSGPERVYLVAPVTTATDTTVRVDAQGGTDVLYATVRRWTGGSQLTVDVLEGPVALDSGDLVTSFTRHPGELVEVIVDTRGATGGGFGIDVTCP